MKEKERDFDHMFFYVPHGLLSPIVIYLRIYALIALNNMMT